MTVLEMLFVLYSLGSGIVLGWVWASAPLKRKVLELETRLKWQTALTMAAESDLKRVRAKAEKLTPLQRPKAKEKR
jgi:hypothetical protein